VVPLADRITLVRGGNKDGIFEKLKSEKTAVVEVETIRAIDKPITRDLSDWGIL